LEEKCPMAKWNPSRNYWYLPDKNPIRNKIGMEPKTEMGKEVISMIHPKLDYEYSGSKKYGKIYWEYPSW